MPGAGLGRLAFEIVLHGYSCQGNEFSVFMLLGSNFILNQSVVIIITIIDSLFCIHFALH